MFNWFQNVPNNTDGKKKLQDKLIPLNEKCVLQSSGAKKSVAWGEKKVPFFSSRLRSFSPRSTWQPVRRLTGRLFWASFLWTLAKRTGKNKPTRQERDALFFHLTPILLFFCSSNTDSVTKRNRLIGPSWLGFEWYNSKHNAHQGLRGNRHLLCLLKESGLGLIFHRPPNLPR